MKVWILLAHMHYDHDAIVAVFDHEPTNIEQAIAKSDYDPNRDYNSWSVKVMDVQGVA
jgi:hypothetical protein